MERNERLHNAMGLAMKAGRVRSGDFVTEKLVRAGGAKLVLLDADVSDNTRTKYVKLCELNQIPLTIVPELGMSVGRPGRMVAAVTDENFKNMIIRALPQ
jgi:ribosomal protein L7Ae-like RNA K-turn-binding protein